MTKEDGDGSDFRPHAHPLRRRRAGEQTPRPDWTCNRPLTGLKRAVSACSGGVSGIIQAVGSPESEDLGSKGYGREEIGARWAAAEVIESEFGHWRGQITWRVDHKQTGTSYSWGWWRDYITFGTTDYDNRWVAGHEFTHALQAKGMGGMWSADNCNPHYVASVSSYKCAFQEGLADYGGTVGDPDNPDPPFE